MVAVIGSFTTFLSEGKRRPIWAADSIPVNKLRATQATVTMIILAFIMTIF